MIYFSILLLCFIFTYDIVRGLMVSNRVVQSPFLRSLAWFCEVAKAGFRLPVKNPDKLVYTAFLNPPKYKMKYDLSN